MAFIVFGRVRALLYTYARRSMRLWKHVRATRTRPPCMRTRPVDPYAPPLYAYAPPFFRGGIFSLHVINSPSMSPKFSIRR